jgi:hypothetical protein
VRLANLEKRPDIAEKLIGSLERRPAGYAKAIGRLAELAPRT